MLWLILTFFLLYLVAGASAHTTRRDHPEPHGPNQQDYSANAATSAYMMQTGAQGGGQPGTPQAQAQAQAEAAAKQAEQEKKKREIAEQEKEFRRVTFNDQCFLLDNIKSLVANPPAKYSNLSVVEGDPAEVYNKLTARVGLSPLMDIKTEELALIKPIIRFFKQRYMIVEGSDTHEPILDDNKQPVMEELIFQDFQNSRNVSILGPNALSAGVGLKSVDYELLGGNPEHGKRSTQRVTVVFWLQNLRALTDTTSGPAFVELISDPSTKLREVDPETGRVKLTDELNPAYRSLHMLYGWGTPLDQAGVMRAHIRRALKSTEVMLKLELISAEVDLQQNGTATLTVKYQAAQEAHRKLAKKDVLKMHPTFIARIKDLEKSHKEQTEHINSSNAAYLRQIEALKRNGEITEEEYKAMKETHTGYKKEDEEEKRRRVDEIKMLKINARENMYRNFIEHLEAAGQVYYVDVSMKEFNENQYERVGRRIDEDYNNMTPEERRAYDMERATNHSPSSLNPRRVTSRTSSGGMDTARAAQAEALSRERAQIEAAQGGEEREAEPVSMFGGKNKADKRVGKDTKRVYFMRFGDILNTAIRHIETLDEATVAVGPIIWHDARTGAPRSMSLADVPISMEYFQVWWIDNVVTKQVTQWKLQSFIESAVGNLIVNTLGTKCFYGTGNVTGKASMAVVDNVKGTGTTPPLKKGERVHVETIDPKSGGDTPNIFGDAAPSFSYLYVFCHTFNMNSLTGDKSKDADKGIYHFSVGNEKGLVKEVSFKKVGNKLVDSARVMRNMADNPNDEVGLSRLHSQYNAELNLVGNSIFKPGQFIYINPSIAGLGDVRDENSVARQLGLGGYFLITKVSGQIAPEGWTTSVGAVHQGYGGLGIGAPVSANMSMPADESSNESSPSEAPLMSSPDAMMSDGW